MSEYRKQIKSILLEINRDGCFHKHTVIALMVKLRTFIEDEKLKKKFEITNFFCNWCQHNQLDYNPTGEECLKQISRVISDSNEGYINDRICEIVSIHTLRKELSDISGLLNVTSNLFNTYQGWKAFLKILFSYLINKPINLKDKPNTGRYASSLKLYLPDISFLNKYNSGKYNFAQNSIFYEVTVLPIGYTITGPLCLTENQSDFE